MRRDSDTKPRADWQQDVWAEIRQRERGRATKRYAALAAGILALVSVFLLWPTAAPTSPTYELAVTKGDTSLRSESPQVGDRLELDFGQLGSGEWEVRIYRNGREIVLQCSRSAPCRRDGERLEVDFEIPTPGVYRPVLVEVGSESSVSPSGSLDSDAGVARRQGHVFQLLESVDVR